jgi:hypothetical protein
LTKTKNHPTLASTWQREVRAFPWRTPPFMLGALPDIKKTPTWLFWGHHRKKKKKKKMVGIFLIKKG